MKKLFVLFLTMLLALSCLASCQKEDLGEVMVQNVGEITGFGAVGIVDRFAGVVVSESETKIEKSDTAEVKDILVKVGDSVKKGQTLFTYDSTMMEFTVEQAKLDLERKKLTLQSQIEDKAKLEEEKAKAKEDQQLAYSLEIRELEANIQESEYNIKLKEQEIEKNEAALQETSVESPVAGRVQTINKDGGYDDYGRPLSFMTIVEEGSYRVQGYINETNLQSLPEGTEVLLRSRVDERTWRGMVSSIDFENAASGQNGGMMMYDGGMSDSTGSSSRYPFYVELEESEGLMLGQHVYIEPDYGQDVVDNANRLMLPVYYISDMDSSPYVFAMGANEKLEKRALTLGESDEMMGTVEVVSGLTADDYIAFPEENLQEGMSCVIQDNSEMEPVPGGETHPNGFGPLGDEIEYEDDGMINEEGPMPEDGEMMIEEGLMPEDGEMMIEEDILETAAEGMENAETIQE